MFLDYFALAVLVILVTAGVVIWVLLGIMPGRIARDRNHPQADVISVCGWWGGLGFIQARRFQPESNS